MTAICAYTWASFVSAVTDLLTVDADRAGIEKYRTAMIRQGVIDIQKSIERYRCGHETLYHPLDMVVEGHASKGAKPPQSVIRDVYLCKICTDCNDRPTPGPSCARFPATPFDWKQRYALVHGQPSVNSGRALFAIDPYGYTFYVYPEVFDCWMLSIFWDGLKLDFEDADETPFDEHMVLAVAEWTKAHIMREVNHDEALFLSYMKSYSISKQGLWLNAKDMRETQGTGSGGGDSGGSYVPLNQTAPSGGLQDQPGLAAIQQVFGWEGDPNGHVTATGTSALRPAVCFDSLNKVTWWKTDGVDSNTGWY